MFKKIASIALAATMVVGGAAISASAAETDQTSAVGADSSSEVGATASAETGSGKVIYFDAKSAGWNNATKDNVFCHIYRNDGDPAKATPGWQSKAEKCTYDPSTGIATYDVETGIKKGFTELGNVSTVNEYSIIFSIKSANETYPVLFNSNCFGDTVYCPDSSVMLENNVDSEKSSVAVKWKNNNLGAAMTITSTGKVQGESFAAGEDANTVLGKYLFDYAQDSKKINKELVQAAANKLNADLTKAYAAFLSYEQDAEKAQSRTAETIKKDKDFTIKVLTTVKDPATGKTLTADELNGVKAERNTNNGTSNNTTDNGGSTTGGTTTNSVSSGQESTIFFVFGGLMLAAAGVMFLARKKRQF